MACSVHVGGSNCLDVFRLTEIIQSRKLCLNWSYVPLPLHPTLFQSPSSNPWFVVEFTNGMEYICTCAYLMRQTNNLFHGLTYSVRCNMTLQIWVNFLNTIWMSPTLQIFWREKGEAFQQSIKNIMYFKFQRLQQSEICKTWDKYNKYQTPDFRISSGFTKLCTVMENNVHIHASSRQRKEAYFVKELMSQALLNLTVPIMLSRFW